jgi:hypothetical protein
MLRRVAFVRTFLQEPFGVTSQKTPLFSILHSHRRENIKTYIALTGLAVQPRRNVFPVRCYLGSYILEEHGSSHNSHTASQPRRRKSS